MRIRAGLTIIIITIAIIVMIQSFSTDRTEQTFNQQTFIINQQQDNKAENYVKYIVNFLNDYRKIQLEYPIDLENALDNQENILTGINKRETYLKTFGYDKALIPEEYIPFEKQLEIAISEKLNGIKIVKEGIAETSTAKISDGLNKMYFANSKLSELEFTIKSKVIPL